VSPGSPPPASRLAPALTSMALGGLAATAYAVAETRRFVLREATMPVLPPGHGPLRVLHLSDLHLTPRQRRKQAWVRELGGLSPDLVVNTGDYLAHRDAVPVVLETLGDLLDVPGVFVFGSNDYFSPTLRNPARYLLPDDGTRHVDSEPLPFEDLRRGLKEVGWLDLTNRRDSLTVRGTTVAFAGVDDPHLEYDDLDAIAGPADPSADLRVGVAHAPYLRVLDQLAADGYDAIFAGHTHGGQVCVPGIGALTTNCDLEPARAKGLHRHPTTSSPGDPSSSWLHVSGGLGTSPYAQIRLACRPEATLLTLTERA
jgi:predicted MPP superfamily phosphohydrolase